MPEKNEKNNLVIKEGSDASISQKTPLPTEKKEMILKTIEIRLEGIGEAAKRSRITFIVLLIACCSMLITIFNAYFSFTRERSFDNKFKYQAVEIADEQKFVERLKNKNGKSILVNAFDVLNKCQDGEEKLAACNEKYNLINDYGKYEQDYLEYQKRLKISEVNIKHLPEPDLKGFREKSLNFINKAFLPSKELYKHLRAEGFYDLFYFDQCETNENKTRAEKTMAETDGSKLIKKIEQKVLDEETKRFYDPTNHLNKLIIDKCFPEITWQAGVSDIVTPVPLYEENKRALSREWLENQNVRINLLGISVNVDQFSLIGSFTLMVISIWMLFSSRRENRAIVSLLRDIREEVEKPDGKKDESDEWDIANLTLHGIAHRLIFAQTGRNDLPMSEKDIFGEKYKFGEQLFNDSTEVITRAIRLFLYTLLLLPVISIGTILIVDDYTTTNTLYPYSNNPVEYFINRNVHVPGQVSAEIWIGTVFGFITFLVCVSCIIFQMRTASALREFEKRLDKKQDPSDSWWENKIQKFWKK